MNNAMKLLYGGMAVLIVLCTACVVEPRSDYYDHHHHRYYHEHTWHDCAEHDDHCR